MIYVSILASLALICSSTHEEPQMLTDKESLQLVKLLGKMERPYPPNVFYALCRNTITCPVDIAALTQSGKVLLFRRPSTDPFFANLWALPGSVQVFPDSIQDVLDRLLLKGELAGVVHTEPVFVFNGSAKYGQGKNECSRGQEETRVHIVRVEEKGYCGPGKFFPLDKIPEDTCGHHRGNLAELHKRFLQHTLPGC